MTTPPTEPSKTPPVGKGSPDFTLFFPETVPPPRTKRVSFSELEIADDTPKPTAKSRANTAPVFTSRTQEEVPQPLRLQQEILPLYELYWMRHGKVPTLLQLNREFNMRFSEDRWNKLFSSRTVQERLLDRGVPLPDGQQLQLTQDQMDWIAVLMNPGEGGTLAGKAKAFGIELSTHYKWMRNPLFAEAIRIATTQLTTVERNRVLGALVNKAAVGDVQAIKLYLELTGEYNPKVTVNHTAQESRVLVSKLIEVLQRHLTPELLETVAGELEAVLFPNAAGRAAVPHPAVIEVKELGS